VRVGKETTETTEKNLLGNNMSAQPEVVCDICGSTDVTEVKCKVICQNCGTILKSCADL
jgi:hypothetical protein